MIIVELEAGFGNQMFQYAAARALAERCHTELKLSLAYFSRPHGAAWTPRKYGLGVFPEITEAILAEEELTPFLSNALSARIKRKLIQKLHLPASDRMYRHKGAGYTGMPPVFPSACRVYLRGFWQSERYFSDCTDLIRRQFTFSEPDDSRNREMLELLRKTRTAVSVHIRRGDYVSNAGTALKHGGICPADYYERAIEIFSREEKDPLFVFFSDEPEWVRKNIPRPARAFYVDWNGGENFFRDMQLMTECSHHIIANSSFSWWGAYLGRNPRKKVIAPSGWFSNGKSSDYGIVPDSWQRI